MLTSLSYRTVIRDVRQTTAVPWLQFIVHHIHHRCGCRNQHEPIHRVSFLHGMYICPLSTRWYKLIFPGFGGAPLVLGGGTIADLVPRQQRGTAMAVWVLIPGCKLSAASQS